MEKLSERIKNNPEQVFLRQDDKDIGNPNQLNRALQILIKRYEMVRIGKGIYSKAY